MWPKTTLLFLLFLSQLGWGQTITSNLTSGFYEVGTEIILFTEVTGEIRYTLDGSEPTASASIYTGPFTLLDFSSQPNDISEIPTNPPNTHHSILWHPPQNNIPKATLLRAAVYVSGQRVSDIFNWEYFAGRPSDIDLPIFSIWADSLGLFGYEEGIYVPGIHYDNNPFIWHPGNYYKNGEEWERVVSVGYYENQMPVFRQVVEMKTHGSGSRIMPCKSLRLSAKNSLGKRYFEHPFFTDRPWEKYKRLILRNSGQDFSRTFFSDALMHSLLKKSEVETQASRPVVVFLNGRYWGIHNLRERYDDYFFENYHTGERDEIDHIELVDIFESGEDLEEAEDFINMHESLLFLDLSSDAAFSAIGSQIDLISFMDNHIAKIYGGGVDWPGNNNEIWRSHQPGAKWRWVASDFDDAFGSKYKDSFGHATKPDGTDWPNPEWSTRLFRHLMTNPGFARQYKARLRFHLDHTFLPQNVKRAIDSLAAIYRPEMIRQTARWNYPEGTPQLWEENILAFKQFAEERPAFVWQNFETYFPGIYLNPAGFVLGPNPASDYLNVELPVDWPERTDYVIYNSAGQLMLTGEVSSEQPNQVDLNSFSTGIYFFEIRGKEERVVKRFMVK